MAILSCNIMLLEEYLRELARAFSDLTWKSTVRMRLSHRPTWQVVVETTAASTQEGLNGIFLKIEEMMYL